MKPILTSSALALIALASRLAAQQPARTAPPASPVLINDVVAVVGDQPITRIDLQERWLGKIQRKELPDPANDSAAFAQQRDVLNDMIDEELLLQKAKDLKIEVADADITPMVDRQIAQVRSQFTTETEYRSALVKGGLGAPEEYRKFLIDQYRRQYTLDKTIEKLTQEARIVPVNVTDAEITAEFDRSKQFLGPKPASVSFKQIIIAPQPTAAAKEVARVKAESLLAQLKGGADFEKLAKRESMDPQSRETGGDLGWARRGTNVPEFDRWLFGVTGYQLPLAPGQMSPVFETSLGYHIVRVDRVQTGEVKAHQILLMAKIDSADLARTRKLADSVAKMLKAGVPFDTLAKKYHDYAGKEETSITPFPRDSLPMPYQQAFSGAKAGDVVTFQIPGAAKRPDVPKFVVAQLQTVDEGGERTLGELKAAIRTDLAKRGGVRRYVDGLKKQTYVSIRLNAMDVAEAKKPQA